MNIRITFLLLGFFFFTLGHSQSLPYSWDEFISHYFSETLDEASYQRLEDLHENPFNLNTATREELLQLPIITTAEVDSILSYRERRRCFGTMGELCLVKGLTWESLALLPLFTQVKSVLPASPPLATLLGKGKHSLYNRFLLPLYQREGQRTGKYLGPSFAHSLRYSYKYGRRLHYGLSIEKDSGEPIAQWKNYPYDAYSFFLMYASGQKRWRALLGDYHIELGQGLAFSSSMFRWKSSWVDAPYRVGLHLRPHTSSSEYGYYRGGALTYQKGHYLFALYSALTPIDARVEHDTIRTIYRTGMHRSLDELLMRRTAYEGLIGTTVQYDRPSLTIALTGYHFNYSFAISPRPRYYNRYYLRGKTQSGASLSYRWKHKRWTMMGECATDMHHWAFIQSVRFQPSSIWHVSLQQRHLSPRYAVAHGYCMQAGSRCQNEQGLLFGLFVSPHYRWKWRSYVDLYYHPEVSYRAGKKAKGLEYSIEGEWQCSASSNWVLRYRMKTKEQWLKGRKDLMQYVGTHRIRLKYEHQNKKWLWSPQIDAACATSQTLKAEWGVSAALKTVFVPHENLQVNLTGAIFSAPTYAASTYIYLPVLYGMRGITPLTHKGWAVSGVCRWSPLSRLQLSGYCSFIGWWDKNEIGTGHQRINERVKKDIGMSVKWNF